jgi:hypothetical protein
MGLRNLGITGMFCLDDLYQSLGCKPISLISWNDPDLSGIQGGIPQYSDG